jgi:pilus assembly protein CpaF
VICLVYCGVKQVLDKSLVGTLAVRDGLELELVGHESAGKLSDAEHNVLNQDDYILVRSHVQDVVRQQFQLEETARSRDPVIRSKFKTIVLYSLKELNIHVDEPDVPFLVQGLFNDVLGYGPLEDYFFDTDVTEIKVIGTDIRIEKHGLESLADRSFESIEHARSIVERMIAPTGRRLDLASARVNARLFDGSRLIAHIAPVAVDGITATIRRFRTDMTAEMLVKNGAISRELLRFLQAAVRSKMNIVVSGGTGSGKTTALNALASFIPEDESLITIEDPAELQLQHSNVRRLEARPPNIEGKGEVTQRDLMVDALRMAPKRIIVGEVRAGEAFDMLQAMNTGHQGSLTTAHANSAMHCTRRLVNMVQMARLELPYEAIIDQIADAVNLFIHVTRASDGRRRFDHIAEVVGTKRSSDGRSFDIKLNMLWEYNEQTEDFDWVAQKFRYQERLREGGWSC